MYKRTHILFYFLSFHHLPLTPQWLPRNINSMRIGTLFIVHSPGPTT